MSSIKSEVNRIGKEMKSKLLDERDDIINIRPHIYFLNTRMAQRDLGAHKTSIEDAHKELRIIADNYRTAGNGGGERIGDTSFVFVHARKHAKSGDVSIFNNEINKIHKIVVDSLNRGQTKADINTGNTHRGHFFSSVAAEARISRYTSMVHSGDYSEQALEYTKKSLDVSRHELYNRLEKAMRTRMKMQKLDVSLDVVHKYRGPNNELEGEFVVFITPQSEELNKNILGSLEQAYGNALWKTMVRGIHRLPTLRQSPSWFDKLGGILDNAFTGISGVIKGHHKTHKKTVRFSTKKSESTTVNIKPKLNVDRSGIVRHPESTDDKSDRSTVPSNLMALLNARIVANVRNNMGKGSASDVLNFRTGRFAESVQITAVTAVRRDHLMVFYNYMKYPYATFDPGGRQYKPSRRGPSSIIDQSIRELAAQLVYDKFAITPRLN